MLTVMSVRFDFNSHPREGGDPRAGRGPAYQRISIPTPVKGVTHKLKLGDTSVLFQFPPP